MAKSSSKNETLKELPNLHEIEIEPKDQKRLTLGEFDSKTKLRGFVVDCTPEPDQDTVVSQITNLEINGKHKLVLHIANYGDKKVKIVVRQL